MYRTTRTVIRKSHPLYEYCSVTTSSSKLLYNATLYRLRNHYTACSKNELTENEKAVEAELDILEASGFSFKRNRKVLSCATLEKLMRVTRVIFYLRADFPHDSWWNRGSIETFDFVKKDGSQMFMINKREVSSLVLKNLIKSDDPSPFPALIQLEVFGL